MGNPEQWAYADLAMLSGGNGRDNCKKKPLFLAASCCKPLFTRKIMTSIQKSENDLVGLESMFFILEHLMIP